ncbi:MAG: hypothetical protein IGS23_06010 [Rivularia sp. T60_A2020_040]|nr:hypothetical protein [Rivularia sp. T60_A2020_040]
MNSFSSLASQLQNQNKGDIIINAIIKRSSDGKIIATVPGLPELQVEASDKITALTLLQQRLEAHLAEVEIVPLPIKLPSREGKNPWLEMAGIFKNDPQFEQMLAAIENYRQELDENLEKNMDNSSLQD